MAAAVLLAGVVPVSCVLLTRVTLPSRPVPTRTLSIVAGKLAPVIVTAVPPAGGPLFGLTLLTVGAGLGAVFGFDDFFEFGKAQLSFPDLEECADNIADHPIKKAVGLDFQF